MAVDESNKISLIPAILMVAGNMMGSGVFMLPANLAGVGSIAVIGWLITIAGSVCLALVFAKHAQLDPAAGGPYAYTRKAFGDYMGYQTNLVYWLANVVGNVGLAVAGLGYLSTFFPSLRDPLVMALAQIAVIWFLTYANILGPKTVSRIQSVTTIFALIPIIGMALLGWFWFNADTFTAGWNVTGKSSVSAVGMTLNFTLWAFIGVESASVSAAVVKNPSKNVPIATVAGVLLAAVCYVLSSTAIMGIIPNRELIASSAPFSDAISLALGSTAGKAVALCAALGCLGSLGGWTLLVGQTAQAAAKDGLFGNIFARENAKGVPSAGLALVAALMSLQVLATMSPSASEQFGKIASVAVIMTLLPYLYSAIALKVLGYKKMPHGKYIFYTLIGLGAAFYCMAAMIGSDAGQTRWALMFVISTVIFYELALNRKEDIEEHHKTVGGKVPGWIRLVTLVVTIVALVATFWVSVGKHSNMLIRAREYMHGISSTPADHARKARAPEGVQVPTQPQAPNAAPASVPVTRGRPDFYQVAAVNSERQIPGVSFTFTRNPGAAQDGIRSVNTRQPAPSPTGGTQNEVPGITSGAFSDPDTIHEMPVTVSPGITIPNPKVPPENEPAPDLTDIFKNEPTAPELVPPARPRPNPEADSMQ